ncbi:electron transfer flavoprotein regulatory factor 1 [Condylostylus longicornis]|uniref:electron transfer flavoprotein regulatory factor 1 n=1 Tax=Condylostylus longicornis TaxID=2530218 RepID=UPI00244E35EA|nr:electron transfer flavoprotein regulatory factor 1 [Condylostylus longicornis]
MKLRTKVRALYKQLLFLGRNHPSGYIKFRNQCHEAFIKNKDEQHPQKIKELLVKGRYICNEIEALYHLKKYRSMKSRYEK